MTNTRGISIVMLAGIAGLPAISPGSIQFYTDQTSFHQYLSTTDKFMKFMEDFEESTAPPMSKTFFPNSLQNGVPVPHFPNGIDATNLIIQTNITPGPCPPTPNPSNNPNALWVNGAGFIGSNSIKVGTDEFLNGLFSSIDLIFTTPNKTAIGLDVSTFQNFNAGHAGFMMCVYDVNDNVLGNFLIPGMTPTEPGKNFFGVWSSVPIGRVNIWGYFSMPQPFAVDNIEMWQQIPTPGTAPLLGIAACALSRRRRSV